MEKYSRGNDQHISKSNDRSRKRSVERFRRSEYTSDGERSSRKESKSRHKSVKKDDPSKKKSKKKKRSESPKRKKSLKHKNRKRTPSSSSSDSSDASTSSADSTKLLEKLQKQRKKQDEERRNQKEMLKATETPEEKRLRRLRKKEAKERKRKERMGWDNDYLHYTNTDNPFGDGNLLSTFVWSKKLEKEGLIGVSREELEARNRHKQEENKRELEKVKKRRQERELERQQREEEMALLQRGKEAAQLEQWARQEDQFHLEQARLRSRIRIQDGRAKPIDLLAKYISAEEEVDAVEMHEPYTYLRGLQIKDLEDLIEDIKVYKELERGKNLDYWNDITVIVEDELHKLRKMDRTEYEAAIGRREGIHASVAKDVTAVFKGKTATQLEALQLQIESKIIGKPEGVDIGYWESLLSQLKAHMARARLRDRHQENLRKKLEVLKAEQGVVKTESEAGDSVAPSEHSNKQDEQPSTSVTAAAENSDESESEAEAENQSAADDMLSESFNDYESGGYSPKYMTQSQLEPGTLVTLEEEDSQRLEFARSQVLNTGRKVQNVISAEEQAMHREARKNMGADEAQFSVESSLEAQIYLWSDKYRPRKPRYFNRVHTGFEWNKYNQTHYDMDNPPPKIVQGYKFNIFYPDLIDKNTTPEYFLKRNNSSLERPKTANLEEPSFLDPRLIDKLDMSMLSKELLCDSMTHIQLMHAGVGVERRRQSLNVNPPGSRREYRSDRSSVATPSNSGIISLVRQKRRSFEPLTDSEACDGRDTSLIDAMKKQSQLAIGKRITADDNNNRRSAAPGNLTPKIPVLAISKRKSSKTSLKSDVELFTGPARIAPEPCKTCGRSDQPERFHSHPAKPAIATVKVRDSNANHKAKVNAVPKSVQKPVALNFRSEKRKSETTKNSRQSVQDQKDTQGNVLPVQPSTTVPAAHPSPKRGPRSVTCYICSREFGTASFPIHEPKCLEKWERENNALPPSQRRSGPPKRPQTQPGHQDWNKVAWEQSQAQLLPCSRCGRTFLPDRLPVHQKSCKVQKKQPPAQKDEPEERIRPDRQAAGPPAASPAISTSLPRDSPMVYCNICGRSFGTRSIKIHEPQCLKRWQVENEGRPPPQRKKEQPPTSSSSSPDAPISQKKTVTCYICGRDFGSTSIAIHEPQCLRKWNIENDKLPPSQRREQPEKPDIVFTSEGDCDFIATFHRIWENHLNSLKPCRTCGRTFRNDALLKHEPHCNGSYYKKRIRRLVGVKTRRK
ncbi:cactin [Diprion similis]|uniref:cactin n=1 Tax=Diprion similis TaxID=362088 RepID=UPI001EF7CD0C|nr:cactin [Diprion similis]